MHDNAKLTKGTTMNTNFGIQKFTTTKGEKIFPVNAGSIVAVYPNDGVLANGPAYQSAGALLVTIHGAYLPVKESFDEASKLWLDGMAKITGNA
jgi:hypothetical protein